MGENKRDDVQELEDDQLDGVMGGKKELDYNGKHYRYEGRKIPESGYEEDWGRSYLCPNCGQPLRYSTWSRYRCDLCDDSWYWESNLIPNIESGLWKEQ